MKTTHSRSSLLSSALLSAIVTGAIVPTASAANFVLGASDAAGASSFNSGLNWVGGAVPAAGNTYQTGAFLLRTPQSAASFAFAGDSLEIQAGGTFQDKTSGTITVGNLIVANTAIVQITRPNNENTATASGTLAGGITLNGTSIFRAGTGNDVAGETFNITSAVSGTGGFQTSGSNGRIVLTADNSFSGGVALNGLANSKLQLGNANAVKNSTVTVSLANGLLFSPAIGTFNLGGLAGASSQLLADTSAGAVALAVGSNDASTTYSGNLTGGGGLTKTGTGTLTLGGANSHTGTTTVNGGQLAISGSLDSASGGAVVVDSGGTLRVTGFVGVVNTVTVNGGGALAGAGDGFATGIINGPVTLAAGSTEPARGAIDLTDGTAATLALGNAAGLTVGGAAGNSSKLVLEAGELGTDLLSLGANPLNVNEGGLQITVVNTGVVANQTYPLISFGSGAGAGFATGMGATVGGITLANPDLSFGISGSLNVTAAGVDLVTSGPAAPAVAYWSGVQGTQWNSTSGSSGNFTTDAAGTQFVQTFPVPSTDVIFAASGNGAPANLASNTLGQDFSIKSLTFANGTGAAGIGGGNTLTLGSGGISLAAGNGGATLSMTSLALDDWQTWSNASSQNLVVSANVSGDAQLTINNTGAGATVLSGANSHSVATVLNAGILRMSGSGTLGQESTDLYVNGGTLELNGTQQVVRDLLGGAAGTVVNNGAANSILTIGEASVGGEFAGLIADTTNASAGTLGLTKAGEGVAALSGLNSYTGPTRLSGGTLSVGVLADGGMASGIGQSDSGAANLVFDGGTLEYTGATTSIDRDFSIIDGKAAVLSTVNDLTLTGTTPATTGGLTKIGTGKLTLPEVHAYTGTTIVDAGTLEITGTLNAAAAEGTGSLVVSNSAGEASLLVSGGIINLGQSGPAAGISGRLGRFAGCHGSLTMTGGQIVVNSGAVKQNFNTGDSGYGGLTMSGGSIVVAGNFGAGANTGGRGVQNISGGSVTVNNGYAGILGNSTNAIAVANYTGTASFTANSAGVQPAPAFVGMAVGEAGAGILNVSGNAVLTLGGEAAAAGLDLGRNNVASASGVVNLGAIGAGGGTITTNAVRHSGAAATGVFNFHGGTLQAATFADPVFMTGLTHAYVYGEGAVIDTNSAAVTVAQPLQTPTGIGITAIGLTANGTDYINAPVVTLTGGTLAATGAVATAVADYNPATGEVTGVTITNSGCYLDTTGVVVNFSGGGSFPAPPVTGAITTAANVSGGLTKTGTGTLTLSSTNTYTGPTTVSGGTLAVNGSISSAVTVNADTVLGGTGTVSGTVTTVGSTSTIAPGVSIGTLNTGTIAINGVFAVELDAVSGDRLNVAGDLTIDPGATLNLIELAPAAASKYVIATYTGTLTGTFTAPVLPAGYSITYDTVAKEISLEKPGFAGFMDNFPGLTPAEKTADADPDFDGIPNLVEYALAGFDPTLPNGSPGTFAGGVLSFTKRDLAVANGDVTYEIEVSTALGHASDPWEVVVATVNDATTISYTLPSGLPKNFVRLKVSQTSP